MEKEAVVLLLRRAGGAVDLQQLWLDEEELARATGAALASAREVAEHEQRVVAMARHNDHERELARAGVAELVCYADATLVAPGLGRIVALHHCSSISYQIH